MDNVNADGYSLMPEHASTSLKRIEDELRRLHILDEEGNVIREDDVNSAIKTTRRIAASIALKDVKDTIVHLALQSTFPTFWPYRNSRILQLGLGTVVLNQGPKPDFALFSIASCLPDHDMPAFYLHRYVQCARALAKSLFRDHRRLLAYSARPGPNLDEMDLEDDAESQVVEALEMKDMITFAVCGDVFSSVARDIADVPQIGESSRLPGSIGGHSPAMAYARTAVQVFNRNGAGLILGRLTRFNAFQVLRQSQTAAWQSIKNNLDTLGMQNWEKALEVVYEKPDVTSYGNMVRDRITAF